MNAQVRGEKTNRLERVRGRREGESLSVHKEKGLKKGEGACAISTYPSMLKGSRGRSSSRNSDRRERGGSY